MARNVEIKARVSDPAATRLLVEGAAGGPPETLEQTDTFFRVVRGRLKLREPSGACAELIYYQRPDRAGPRESRFERTMVQDAAALRDLLSSALGVYGRVSKRRLVFRVGRTRVHLDEVAGLGDFLELEVELQADEPADAGAEEARRLMNRFGIQEDALVPEAYVDLLNPGGLRMPVEWQVDHVRRLVVTDAHGTLTSQEILRYQREVWSRPDVAGYDELVDMSDVQDTQATTKLIQELAALSATMDPEGSRSKFAIVAPQQAIYGLARMYETYRGMEDRSTKRVGVFRDRAEALLWLAGSGLPPEPRTPGPPNAGPLG